MPELKKFIVFLDHIERDQYEVMAEDKQDAIKRVEVGSDKSIIFLMNEEFDESFAVEVV